MGWREPELARDRREAGRLVLACARVLYVNGQTTEETVAAARRLAHALDLPATVIPRWGELQLDQEGSGSVAVEAADPTGVDMHRVAAAMKAIDEIAGGRLSPVDGMDAIDRLAHAPPSPTWLFALAAAAGAEALSVIFGVEHLVAVVLIGASAAVGAVLRRFVARYSTNALLQPLGAALLAGVVGALAVRNQLSSALRLVAVCPCMILVPGPHMLNGMTDLAANRIHLGASRLVYAGLVVLAIATGLRGAWRLVTGGRARPGGAVLARHDRGRGGSGGLQHLLLDPVTHAGLAGRGGNGGARTEMVDAHRRRGGCSGWSIRGVSGCRAGPGAGRSYPSYAVRGDRLRRGGLDDSGGVPVQDGERPGADGR
jgi:uncharacterized membrane protein YjjP (DUF1212 family)